MNDPSFFEIVTAPYYFCIGDYKQKNAGVRAMYYLCHALNELGQEAYIVGAEYDVMHLRCPRLQLKDFKRHQQGQYIPIAIYPEVVKGNPFDMPHVVRWLLNKPGLLGGDEKLSETEMVFVYSADYMPEGFQLPLLPIPVVNYSIFHNINNPYDLKREGQTYYADKYLRDGGMLTEHVNGAQSLCQDVNLTPDEIADILRKSELLYCYEPSAIIGEALLCGCPVVIIPSPYTEKNLKYPIAGEGIASTDSEEDIAYAKETISICQQNNVDFHGHCWNFVRNFIDKTQTEFACSELTMNPHEKLWGEQILNLLNQQASETDIKLEKLPWVDNKRWLENHSLTEGQAVIMAEQMHHNWLHQPTFHLIMVLNPDELVLLPDTLESLQQQLYTAWGLSIITPMEQPDFLMDLPENIEWIQLQATLNETINQTVNETGLDWILQLMPGDKLLPHALWSFSDCMNQNPDYHFIYSDEIQGSQTTNLVFKPDFNLELLRSSSYIGRSAIIRRDIFEEIGGYTGLAYVDITDLAFQVYESWGELVIGHIDDVLYHASDIKVDTEIFSDNELAVRVAHIARQGINARVLTLPEDTFQTKYLLDTSPLVSVVIANKNNASAVVACVHSVYGNTSYQNYELLIVDQMSDIEDMPYIYQDFQELFGSRLTLLEYHEANYSAAINYGVSQAKGDYVVVMSSLVMPVNDSWLTELVANAQQDSIGVVGVKVVEEDAPHKVIHAGGVLGAANDVTGLLAGMDYDDVGYMNRAMLAQEYTFVSSAAFIVNKSDFVSVGGLDEGALANTHYCVSDFCLKILDRGSKNIWTPQAVFRQGLKRSSANNGICDFNNEGAEDVLIQRCRNYIEHDAAYNRNLTLMEKDYSVQTRFTVAWSEKNYGKPRVMAFPFSQGAVGEFRTRAPLNYLANQGQLETCFLPNHENIITPFIPSKFEVMRVNPDIIYFNNALQDVHYTFLQWLKSETNVFVVFAIDDLIISLPKKNDARRLSHKDIRHRLRRTLALCDRLIVSTQPLAVAFSDYCDDIVVVPNSIDMARWSTVTAPSPQKREKLRVGWAGGELHRGDLEMIVDLVKETSQAIDWVFMGMCPEDLKPYLHEFHAFTSFADYPEKMAALDLDLAIAPLEQNLFNESKSNLRLLEYGILGWPVICTDIYPYQTNNPPVVRVENTKMAWVEAILTAASQPELLKQQGAELRQWVLENYTLDLHAEIWFKAIVKR
jgi:glycosyltransferase involved in cell wall biosynthesis